MKFAPGPSGSFAPGIGFQGCGGVASFLRLASRSRATKAHDADSVSRTSIRVRTRIDVDAMILKGGAAKA